MKKTKISRVLPLLLLTPLLFGCGNKSKYTKNVYAYGTTWIIEIYDGGQEDIDYVESLLLETSKIFDDEPSHFESGDLYALNHAASPIKIDERLYDLLLAAQDIKNDTSGLFNVCSKGLNDLYKAVINSENPSLPEENAVQVEVNKIANTSITLSADGYAFIEGDGRVDVGAIAKGYALDLINRYFISKNIKRFVVNGGNSSILLGKTQNNGSFTLSMEDDPSFSKEVSDCYIGVSSVSKQHVEVGETLVSHIVNPLTGSATPRFKAALDIFPSIDGMGMITDAYSTAIMNASDTWINDVKTNLGMYIHTVGYGE